MKYLMGLMALLLVLAFAPAAQAFTGDSCSSCSSGPSVVDSGPYLTIREARNLSWRLAHKMNRTLPSGTSDVQVGKCNRLSRRHVDCALAWRQNGCYCHLVSHVIKSRHSTRATTQRRDYRCQQF